MARLCFSARSRSKCKNPIPIQAQKRLLSKGGPPEDGGGGELLQEDPASFLQGAQEAGPLHTTQCESNCPIWHVDPRLKTAVVTLRLLQLSNPKLNHPDFQSNRQSVESIVSFASKSAQISQRLVQLSLPRLKQSNICSELGRPEEPIWTVPRAAARATASAHVETLAAPKQLSKDYIPPQEPEWSRRNVQSI